MYVFEFFIYIKSNQSQNWFDQTESLWVWAIYSITAACVWKPNFKYRFWVQFHSFSSSLFKIGFERAKTFLPGWPLSIKEENARWKRSAFVNHLGGVDWIVPNFNPRARMWSKTFFALNKEQTGRRMRHGRKRAPPSISFQNALFHSLCLSLSLFFQHRRRGVRQTLSVCGCVEPPKSHIEPLIHADQSTENENIFRSRNLPPISRSASFSFTWKLSRDNKKSACVRLFSAPARADPAATEWASGVFFNYQHTAPESI